MRRLPNRGPDARPRPRAGDVEKHSNRVGALPRREVVGMSKRQVKVVVYRDPDDHSAWLAKVPGVRGAHTFGRSLAEAKRHAVEMVALWFDVEPDLVTIEWDVRLGELSKPVSRARAAIAHAETDRARRDAAVRALTEAGVSYRDVAELLGLSHQRIAQITRAS
jgi:predicted RNase H-like HicB family nuclease